MPSLKNTTLTMRLSRLPVKPLELGSNSFKMKICHLCPSSDGPNHKQFKIYCQFQYADVINVIIIINNYIINVNKVNEIISVCELPHILKTILIIGYCTMGGPNS